MWPVSPPRSKPRAAEQRRERRAEDRPVEEKVDGDDGRRLELRLRLPEELRGLGRRERDDDRVGVQLVRTLDPVTCGDLRSALLERLSGRIAVHGPERPGGEDHVRGRRLSEQCRPHGEDAHRRARLVGAEVERRTDEYVPDAVDLEVGSAEPAEECSDRLAVYAFRAAEREQRSDDLDALAPRKVAVAEDRERRAADRGDAGVFADDRELEPATPVGAALADSVEEREVLGEAPERDVLPVVRRRRRVAVTLRERLHRTSQRRPGLEERDVVRRVGKLESGGQAREAPPPGPALSSGHLGKGCAGIVTPAPQTRDDFAVMLKPRVRGAEGPRGGSEYCGEANTARPRARPGAVT